MGISSKATKIFLPVFTFMLSLLACQTINKSFNPFNQEFTLHENFNISDYDTIRVECGYWNLTKNSNGLSIYYQYFLDEKDIVAKGFDYRINEVKADSIFLTDSYDSLKNILESHPLDLDVIKSDLQAFGIVEIDTTSDSIENKNIQLIDINNIIHDADIIVTYVENEQKLIREISFFNWREL